MEDFVSNAFFNLIAVELKRQGFDATASSQFAGRAPRSNKKNLLDAALTQLGPAAVLNIGAGIHRIHFDPTLSLLLKAVSVQDLLERWRRLEGYMHGQHRVQTVEFTGSSTTLKHYALAGNGPSESENLVLAGLFAALFHGIGVNKLCVSIGGFVVMSDDVISDDISRLTSTQMWTFTWKSIKQVPFETRPLGSNETVVDRVRLLLMTDIGRSWNLASIADILAISTRSLQRRLEQSGSSFQSLLRITRAECAASMLLKNDHSLSAIGYATGFSDQAHFSRDFKLRFNMSPSEYVALSR